MLVWAYCRHYLNLRILWAVLTTFKTIGPYELNWETQQYKCLLSQVITFSLLAALQSVNIFWFFLICRIAKNYVWSGVAQDERSEQGDDDEEIEGSTQQKRELLAQKLEEKTGMGVTDSPQVLLNGEPLADSSSTDGGSVRRSTRRRKA